MNRERVQMLRDMMAGIPEKQIYLDSFYQSAPTRADHMPCGTVACIAGWACIYPPFVEAGIKKSSYFLDYAAAKFFDVDEEVFFERQPEERGGTDKEVALRRLDRLLKARKPSARVKAK